MNTHRYFPHTAEDIATMLERCQASGIDELWADIPDELRLHRPYDIPPGMSEDGVRAYFDRLMSDITPLVCFAGDGTYDHYCPAVIADLARRSEFLTAYTPYQPEISQGTLQYIYEYQSMICELTGLDVANASLYDGATATAEAMLMCVAAGRKRNRVLMSSTVSQAVKDVVTTYARYHGVTLDIIPETDGVTDREAIAPMLNGGDVAGAIFMSPNRHGIIEDFSGVADSLHAAKALMALNTHASALGVLRTPSAWGADIAVGEAQSLGMPMNFGGPGLGYMAVTQALMRKMPGRVVGATTDADGQRVFVLTLQAREQHIRRAKATSNICSNQGIMTLYAAAYLSLMGAQGLAEVNRLSHDGACELRSRLLETGVVTEAFPGQPVLNEFEVVLNGVTADDVIARAAQMGLLPGVKVADDRLLIAVTERRTPEQINLIVSLFKSLAS